MNIAVEDDDDECPNLIPINLSTEINEECSQESFRVPVTIITGFLGIGILQRYFILHVFHNQCLESNVHMLWQT